MPDPTNLRPLLPRHYGSARPLFLAATEALKTFSTGADEDDVSDAIADKVGCRPIEAVVAWRLVAGLPPLFGEQSGASAEDAIHIHADHGNTSDIGVSAEYHWLRWKIGEEGEDYTLLDRGSKSSGKVALDYFNLHLESGETRTVWFDISQFYGK